MPVAPTLLHRFPFLRSLDGAELEQVAKHIEERLYLPHAIIFPDGVIGDKFYLLGSGHVQIVKPTSDGEVLLNDLQPGDSFGEMSLLDGKPRSASARAADEVSLLEMPKDVFLSLIHRFPTLLYITALENAQRLRRSDLELIDELRARNQELHELYQTSLDISRHLELRRLLAAITERAESLLDSVNGALHLFDHAKHLLIAPRPHKHVRPGEGPTGRAFTSGGVVLANASTETSRGTKLRRSILAAPVSLDQNKLGTLTVYRPTTAAPFSQDDAQLLLLLANQAAIAIENARLYELSVEKGRLDGELRAARQLQRSLIPPRAPHLPGFQLMGLWRPAREVSGDFYDFIPLDRGRWGLAIADVSDKGAPAALFMAIARSVLRASAIAELDAARAIERANRLLTADSTRGMFVTLFFCLFEPHARNLTYVNAGHNPPLLLRAANHQLEWLNRHGPALGIDADARWASHTIELGENDLLVLYTDGVTEALNARDEVFGEARLARIVKASGGTGATAVVRALDRGVDEFIGTRTLADDVTLVVLSSNAEKHSRI